MYYIYILTNKTHSVLYTGVTNNLARRMYEHKNKVDSGFTSKYNVHILVFVQNFPTALEAISAEKKIKGWTRAKKVALIDSLNPGWEEISAV